MASMEQPATRRFSGSGDTEREYPKWKKWCRSAMAIRDKLPPTARGPFIYTLLDGPALEAVDHLSFEDYSATGGEKLLWDLLDARFPEKDKSDEMGEALRAMSRRAVSSPAPPQGLELTRAHYRGDV